jgi:hypothetical protein
MVRRTLKRFAMASIASMPASLSPPDTYDTP